MEEKEKEYEKIIEAGFDSEEIADAWYDYEGEVGEFIEYLSGLEVEAELADKGD